MYRGVPYSHSWYMKTVVPPISRIEPAIRRVTETAGRKQIQANNAPASTMKQTRPMAAKSSRFASSGFSLPLYATIGRYRNSIEYTNSRTSACSCSLSGRARRRPRRPAKIDFSAIRPGPGSLRQSIGKPFADGEHFFPVPSQDFHELRIKMPAGVLLHVHERFCDGPRRFIGADRGERVVDVRDGDDSRFERDMFAPEPGRVAAAVVLLVMPERDYSGHLQVSGRAVLQHVVADARVGLHDSKVLAVQPSGILQDPVRYADFSDIVHRRGQLDRILLRRGQPHAFGDKGGVLRHPHQVHSGHLVALLGGLRQPKQRLDFAPPQFTGGLVDLLFENPGPVFLENFMPAQAKEIAAARPAFEPIDGTDQEIGRSRLQSTVADFAIVDHRDAHDRNVLVAENAAQPPDDLDPIQARHLVIGEHHVDGMLARVFDGLQGVGERGDLQTRVKAPHDLAQHDAPGRLVVDNQDLERRELGFDRVVNQRKRSGRRRGFHKNFASPLNGRLPTCPLGSRPDYTIPPARPGLGPITLYLAGNCEKSRFAAFPAQRLGPQAARCFGAPNIDSISRRTRTGSAPAS